MKYDIGKMKGSWIKLGNSPQPALSLCRTPTEATGDICPGMSSQYWHERREERARASYKI